MAEVRWTPQAVEDLEAICLFIARDAPQVAALFADRIMRATDRLGDHPRLGRVVPEFSLEDLREVIVGSYRVFTGSDRATFKCSRFTMALGCSTPRK